MRVGRCRSKTTLIVYCALQDSSRNAKFHLRGSVYDRIRGEFITRRDHVVWLRLYDPPLDVGPAAEEFAARLRDCIVSAFDQLMSDLHVDIETLDEQRATTGWQFLELFSLKEDMATICENIGMIEDALREYDGLAMRLSELLSDQRFSSASFDAAEDDRSAQFGRTGHRWPKEFGANEPGDLPGEMMSYTRKAFRELIDSKAISLFDLRTYLFARQCRLLLVLHRPVEICQRAYGFIVSMGRELMFHRRALEPAFPELWTYWSCNDIVNACEGCVSLQPEQATRLYYQHRGDLWCLARWQLDRLGVRAGILPSVLPFVTTFRQSDLADGTNLALDWIRQKLSIAEADVAEGFDRMYIHLTSQIAESFKNIDRKRLLIQVVNDLAALNL